MSNDKYIENIGGKDDSIKKEDLIDIAESASITNVSNAAQLTNPNRKDALLEIDIVSKQFGRSIVAAVKPGAYSASSVLPPGIDGGHMVLLGHEADILAKQRGNLSLVGADSRVEQDVNPGVHLMSGEFRNENVHPDLEGFEADVAAKQLGRLNVVPIAKPGAYSTTSSSMNDNVNPELHVFEADVLVNQRGKESVSSTSVSSFEQDIAAKQKGRPKNVKSATPGAYAASSISRSDVDNRELRTWEAEIMAKQRAGVTQTVRDDILFKGKGRSTAAVSSKPGSRSSSSTDANEAVRDLEADVRAKQADIGSSRYKLDEKYISLEANICAKQNAHAGKSYSVQIEDPLERDCVAGNQVRKTATVMSSELRELEADIVAKRNAVASLSPTSVHDSAYDKFRKINQNGNDDAKNKITLLESLSKHRGPIDPVDNSNLNGHQSPLRQGNLHGLEYGEFGKGGEDGLAVAVAVEDGDADIYLPSAVEFDPDAKPPMYRNRRFRLYIFLMITAAIIGAVGAALGIIMTVEESPPEVIPYRTTLGIRENIARIVSSKKLDDYTSPYKKAMDWITFVDPMELTPDSPKFLNRYVLAYFYYATSEKNAWTSDCAPLKLEREQCKHAFLDTLETQKYKNRTSFKWLSNADECEWAGITCDSFNQVRNIELSNIGMSGTFPEGLSLLPYLQLLDLRHGELEGPLPSFINSWKNLVYVGLEYHRFTGTIPDRWFDGRSWQYVLVPGNQITGKLSGSISKLENLVDFNAASNLLTGSIPTEIGLLVNLVYIVLNSNELNGPFPKSFGKLSQLLTLRLHRNLLTGKIPEEIGDCAKLQDFFIDHNLLTGPLPDVVWDMPNLTYAELGDNMLTGSISGRLSKLTSLVLLHVENNQFTGSFPARLGTTKLRSIHAYGNNFNGTVETTLCNLVDKGQISELEFDCAMPLDGGMPDITCPEDCCSVCCYPDGKDCIQV